MQTTTQKQCLYFEIDGQSQENRALENEPYYFDEITTEKASEILYTLKKEGAFLVRKRSVGYSPSLPYSLSVFYDNKVHHTRIKCDKNGQFMTESKDLNPRKFSSVSKLIKFLNEEAVLKLTTRYNNVLATYKNNFKILQHSNKSFDPHEFESFTDLPYFLGSCSREKAEKILLEIKQDEVFFIRNLEICNLKETPFELLVFYKNCIHNLKIHRSQYDAYSIETNDMHFETLPEMIKYYNYNKLKIASNISVRLQIHFKYIII